MRKVTVAATQMAVTWNREESIKNADKLVRQAAAKGAQVILIQELFETPYFCQTQDFKYLDLATYPDENPAIRHFRSVARELHVVLPISFFERHGNTQFNSVAMIDADGEVLGIYRKTHIPDGLPYAEKFYFTPGDTGFKVWDTAYGKIGVGICWDQWFPEAARAMALMGAEMLLYPTAIGNEPYLEKDSRKHWCNVMRGHAAANMMPVIASNRIGREVPEGNPDCQGMVFYGTSFIADQHGELVVQADDHSECVLTATFDLDELADERRQWGIFRDRRPEMYKIITTHGVNR